MRGGKAVRVRGPAATRPRTAPARTRVDPRLLLVAIAAGAAGLLAMWWTDTVGIHGVGDWLTNAGRLTGLLAGYSIAMQLLLMARVPLIEHSVGADRLARWHAFGGRYTISLATSHVLLITWGYAVTGHQNVVRQTSDFLLTYPDVLMATAAFGLLVLVGVTSARKARARMAYETWYHLHFSTSLAVALAFSHQFATGADFINNLRNRVLWSVLYAGTAALLIWYRGVVPVRALARHRMRVVEVHRESQDVVSITLAGDHLDELGAEPGQFFRWRFLTREHWWQSHPYSLSAPPDRHRLRITVKSLGDHSAQLQQLRRGTRVLAEGPFGAFTAHRRRRRKVLLLAGGVGITPLRVLLETLPASRGDLTLIYRVNTAEEIVLKAELDAVASRRGARVLYLAGAPGSEQDPFVGSRLRTAIPGLAAHDVFICGPPGFATAAISAARRGGVPARFIHDEQFAF
jgi:predicted ferric reductase